MPAPAPAPPEPVAVEHPPAEPEAEAAAEPDPPLPEIREPAAVACRLTAEDWSFEKLRTTRKGTAFARAREAPTTLVLPVTERAESATAVLDDGQVAVRALVDAEDLRLYVRPQATGGPVLLLGIVAPTSDGTLDWVSGARDAGAGVAIDAGPFVLSPNPVVDTVACDRLALVPAELDVRGLITKQRKLPKLWTAQSGVPIRRDPKAEPAAELAGGVEVEILEARGKLTRILYETPWFLVVGWVPSKDLTRTPGAGFGYGGGRGAYGRKLSSFRGDSCAQDLPLIVEVGSERTRVGTIRAKSSFRLPSDPPKPGRRPSFVPIELPRQTWLELVPPARFVVSADELERCSG